MKHDSGYHLLFSHPVMVRELIEGFVDQPWVADINFDTLTRVNAKWHSPSLERREGDVIYKLESKKGRPIYVYLFLEFQSKPDKWMALRFSVYIQLFWQHLIKENNLPATQKLPAVFPLVLYNGDSAWSSNRCLGQLIDLPKDSSLREFQPEMTYYLLEERVCSTRGSTKNSLVALLFRLENCRDIYQMQELLYDLGEIISSPAYSEVKRDIVAWLDHVRLPGFEQVLKSDTEYSGRLDTSQLSEVKIMLAERIKQWERELIEQGLEQGLEQGEEKGKEVALRDMLTQLLTQKFGPHSTEVSQIIALSNTEQLQRYMQRILSAETINSVFE